MADENPWLAIPAADYEGHMGEGGVDQLGPLRRTFAEVYRAVLPARLAVLGCGAGGGLEVVEASRTRRMVGVDLNPEYLALARKRHAHLAAVAEWVCAPVERCELEAGGFELVHAALLFEYVDPAAVLSRIARWLSAAGVLSVVLQLPGGDATISDTPFPSLRRLSALMRLVSAEQLVALAAGEGLSLRSSSEVPLARGKRFWGATFGRV